MKEEIAQSSTASQSPNIVAGGDVSITYHNEHGTRIPLQRPPRVQHFTGRQKELRQLLQDLKAGHVVTLCGPGGTGKSALASEVIWQLSPENVPPRLFPDGIIWHDFYQTPSTEKALEHIVLSFGGELHSTVLDAARRTLAGKTVLLLLDGTERTDNLPAILSIIGNCGVILTSRIRKDAIADWKKLGSLEINEAMILLQSWGAEFAFDEIATRKICELVGCLPLAIRLIGQYMRINEESATEYIEWLQQSPLDALDHGRRISESIPLLLQRSIESLSAEALDALRVAGVLAFSPFSSDMLVAVLPEISPRRALDELVNYGLLTRVNHRYQVTHALLHTYLREYHIIPDGVFKRLLSYYESFVHEQLKRGTDGYTALDLELKHLVNLIELCKQFEDWKVALDMVHSIGEYLSVRGYWFDRKRILEIGLEAAKKIENEFETFSILGDLHTICFDLGLLKEGNAFFKQWSMMAQPIASNLKDIGNMFEELQGLLETSPKSQDIETSPEFQELKDLFSGFQASISALDNVQKEMDFIERASDRLENLASGFEKIETSGVLDSSASKLFEETDELEKFVLTHHLSREGISEPVVASLKDCKTSKMLNYILKYEKNFLLLQRFRYDNDQLLTWELAGHLEDSIEYHEKALSISQKIEDRNSEACLRGNLGITYYALNKLDLALGLHQEALKISREIGDREIEGKALCNIGIIYYDRKQIEEAKQSFQQSRDIFKSLNLSFEVSSIERRLKAIHP